MIGIGAGPSTDGQVLVLHDLLGIHDGFQPKFVKRYADAQGRRCCAASTAYAEEVRTRRFPGPEHTYGDRARGARAAAGAAAARTRTTADNDSVHNYTGRAMAGCPSCSRRKEREFFDLFEEAGANIVRAAELLERMLQQWPDHGELAPRRRSICEQEGDRITHDIIQRLNQTFVTPIDREDIYALASGARRHRRLHRGGRRLPRPLPDRGADGAGAAAGADPPPGLPRRSAARSRGCAPSRTSATTRSRSTGSRTRATGVLREALASLFERGIDPMMVIRWKDIFERLEDAIDSTETVGEHPRGHRHQEPS